MDAGTQLARSHEISTIVGLIYRRRVETAAHRVNDRLRAVAGRFDGDLGKLPQLWAGGDPASTWQYRVDAGQRAILFWDPSSMNWTPKVGHQPLGFFHDEVR